MFNNLPGRVLKRFTKDDNVSCEDCFLEGKDVRAVVEVQGETDSFGYEPMYLCEDCHKELQEQEPEVGCCDWCKTGEQKLSPTRSVDEFNGPVYYVCPKCIRRQQEYIAEELESF